MDEVERGTAENEIVFVLSTEENDCDTEDADIEYTGTEEHIDETFLPGCDITLVDWTTDGIIKESEDGTCCRSVAMDAVSVARDAVSVAKDAVSVARKTFWFGSFAGKIFAGTMRW